jgi:predicted Ser/Thr protein kinase
MTKNLELGRIRTTAAQVGNKVYIAGGEISNLVETDSIEVLNLDSLEFEESNLTLPTLRQQFTATVVGSNIYYAGGFYHEPTITFYDYETFNFTRLPRAPWAVDVKHIEFMNDNRTLYVFAPNTLDIYNRDTNTWTTNEEYRSIVTNLFNYGFGVVEKTVFIVGGFNATTSTMSSEVYIFDMTTNGITKVSGQILPQFYPTPMDVSYSSTGVLMNGGFNGTSTNQIINVFNRQNQQWLSTNLDELFPQGSAVSQGAVTELNAFVVVTRLSPQTGNGLYMRIPFNTLVPDVQGLGASASGTIFDITANGPQVFIFTGGPTVQIFNEGTFVQGPALDSSLNFGPNTKFYPFGTSVCFMATGFAQNFIICVDSSGVQASFGMNQILVDVASTDTRLYLYYASGLVEYIDTSYALINVGTLASPALFTFGDQAITATTVYPVGSTVISGSVGGDIPANYTVITRRNALANDVAVLSYDPSTVVVYPSVIEVLNTVNNTWSSFDVPEIGLDTVIYAGALDKYLVLVCYNGDYFIDTTNNELANITINLSLSTHLTSIKTHLQLPVYTDKLITGIASGITMFNTTTSVPLNTRSESGAIVNQLIVYDGKLFVADVSANQFYFYVLSQNRWDARLLSGRRTFYSIAAVDSKVFIYGGRTEVTGVNYGVYPNDYTFYFEFNTASSGLSTQLNITYPRSEITPISTGDAAIFIGGKAKYGTYFNLVEIYTNRTFLVPVIVVTPEESPTTSPPDPGVIAGAVVGSVVGAAAIGLGLFFGLRAKKRKDKKAQRMATIRTTVNLDDAIAKHPMYTPFAEIKFGKMLGSGANGQVFLGRWKSTDVALKVSMSQANEGFIQEVNLMLGLRPHPNVVRIFGFSIHPETQNVILILEFCDGGSLDNILFDDPNDLPMAKKLAWIQGIARGVLHLQSNNIVHRDLAARNVLLHRGEAKITDFGMSRVVDEGKKGTTTSDIGPIRWMAPESIANKEYSTKSDVWSFAVIMYEIISRQEPHVAGDPLEIAVKIRDQGATPGIPDECPEPLATIMQRCWTKEAQQRPTFQEITDYLDKVKL